jgi:hypothetical protein
VTSVEFIPDEPEENHFSVLIGGVPYTIKYVPSNEVCHKRKQKRLFGQISYTGHNINISNESPKEKQQLTLLHEILHGIIAEYNIKELQSKSGGHSEAAIDQLSLGLFGVLNSLDLEVPYESTT